MFSQPSLPAQSLRHFLAKHSLAAPYVLAHSGGPDSWALCLAFLELGLPLRCIHIDHGWRKDSALEAAHLKEQLAAKGVALSLHRLSHVPSKDAENSARHSRLQVYREELGSQPIFVAHHSDDQKETVLKRMLEQADLWHLSGLEELRCVEGVLLARPLLGLCKQELLSYCEKQQQSYVQDATNLSELNLRGRFRTQLIPAIEYCLNKRCTVTKVSQQARQLQDYLDRVLQPWLAALQNTEEGFEMVFPEEADSFLLDAFLSRQPAGLSFAVRQTLIAWLQEEKTASLQAGLWYLEVVGKRLCARKNRIMQ